MPQQGRCATCKRRVRTTTLERNNGMCVVCAPNDALRGIGAQRVRASVTRQQEPLADLDGSVLLDGTHGRLWLRNGRCVGYALHALPNGCGAFHIMGGTGARESFVTHDDVRLTWTERVAQPSREIRTLRGRGAAIYRAHLRARFGTSPSTGDNASRSIVRDVYAGAIASYAPRGTHTYGNTATVRTLPLSGATRRATARLNVPLGAYTDAMRDDARESARALARRIHRTTYADLLDACASTRAYDVSVAGDTRTGRNGAA